MTDYNPHARAARADQFSSAIPLPDAQGPDRERSPRSQRRGSCLPSLSAISGSRQEYRHPTMLPIAPPLPQEVLPPPTMAALPILDSSSEQQWVGVPILDQSGTQSDSFQMVPSQPTLIPLGTQETQATDDSLNMTVNQFTQNILLVQNIEATPTPEQRMNLATRACERGHRSSPRTPCRGTQVEQGYTQDM